MGLFDRIRDSVRRTLTASVEGLEQRHPEAVYAQAIEEATLKVREIRTALSGLTMRRQQVGDRAERALAAEAELERAKAGALAEADDDTALVLHATLVERRKNRIELDAEQEQLSGQISEARELLAQGQALLRELAQEKEGRLVELKLAEAQIAAQDALDPYSSDPAAQGLTSVRDAIGRLNRQAHPGYLDSEGNSIRGRAAALGKKAAKEQAREELERLKADLRGDEDA